MASTTETCLRYDDHARRWCRNKPLLAGLCRRHLREWVARYEKDNPQLMTYLQAQGVLTDGR